MKRGESPEAMLERFTIYEPNSGCQLWLGGLTRGYGTLAIPETRRHEYAHRWNYRRLVGPIPPGMELDHRCRVTTCVNVRHLEAVTHAENVRRARIGYEHQTVCPCGRSFDYRDSLNRLRCRTCTREYQRVYQRAWGAANKEKKREWKRRWDERQRQRREAAA